jgi:hypothetical protein
MIRMVGYAFEQTDVGIVASMGDQLITSICGRDQVSSNIRTLRSRGWSVQGVVRRK